jgi:hypothetical protein
MIGTLGITAILVCSVSQTYGIQTSIKNDKDFDSPIHNIALVNTKPTNSTSSAPLTFSSPTTSPSLFNANSGLARLLSTSCQGGFPCQSSWNIEANGLYGALFIQSVDSKDKLNGTLFNNPINGSWNQYSRKITFDEISSPRQTPLATFSGYLNNMCGFSFSGPACLILAGSFQIPGLKQEAGWAAVPLAGFTASALGP